ncbi:conserved protein of unknown function [Ectopseudomonas oleovorans]|uniref:Uncharacterized protein n=1 Tax=Ectopseudomonas oleovorans TaxID=301 RepID=A0A653AXT5_ECTOL|nr:conserved protein of unknown function [Pseudomonas oleovorans]
MLWVVARHAKKQWPAPFYYLGSGRLLLWPGFPRMAGADWRDELRPSYVYVATLGIYPATATLPMLATSSAGVAPCTASVAACCSASPPSAAR